MATVYVTNNPCIKNAAGGYSFNIMLFNSSGIAVSGPTIATGDFKFAGDGGTPANITAPTADGVSVTVVLTQAQINYNRILISWADAAGDEWVSGAAYIETVTATTVSDLTQADILDDATPFSGADIDAAISSRSSYTPASDTLEGALTYDEVFRIVLSALAGLVSGGGTTTLRFRDYADSKDRIVATVTAQGNRTVITLDGS